METTLQLHLPDEHSSGVILNALTMYTLRLEASLETTRERLSAFERKYNVTTLKFLGEMTAEDLRGGDDEYVQWAGEASLLERLRSEMETITYVKRSFH